MGNWGVISPYKWREEILLVTGKHLKPEIRIFQPAYHVFFGISILFLGGQRYEPMFLVILDLPPVESEGVFGDSLVKNVIFLVVTVTGSRGRSNAYICLFVIPTDTSPWGSPFLPQQDTVGKKGEKTQPPLGHAGES